MYTYIRILKTRHRRMVAGALPESSPPRSAPPQHQAPSPFSGANGANGSYQRRGNGRNAQRNMRHRYRFRFSTRLLWPAMARGADIRTNSRMFSIADERYRWWLGGAINPTLKTGKGTCVGNSHAWWLCAVASLR